MPQAGPDGGERTPVRSPREGGVAPAGWRTSCASRLPPGPTTPRGEVAAHQRARLCQAMIELASEREVDELTVESIISRAHVSKHTLYEHFYSKDDCFLQTYGELAAELTDLVASAHGGSEHWLGGMRLALAAVAERIAGEPAMARLLLLAPVSAGEMARVRAREMTGMCEEAIARSLAAAPGCVTLPRPLAQGILAGFVRVVRVRLLSGRERELIRETDELARWAVSIGCVTPAQLTRLQRLQGRAASTPLALTGAGRRGHMRRWSANCQPITPARELILEAAARIVGREGAGALTPARIRRVATLTPREFREQFDFEDMSSCFTASVEHVMARELRRALRAGAEGTDWAGGLYRALHSICESARADEAFAKIVFVEVLARGADGVRAREETITALAERLRAEAPSDRRPSPLAAEASVAAAWRAIHERVAVGQTRRLSEVAPLLTWFVLAPVLGERSIEAIAVEQERMARAFVGR